MRIAVTILLVLLFQVTLAQTWNKLNGPAGGRASRVAYDASTGRSYSLVNDFLFVSTNDGGSWSQLTSATLGFMGDFTLDGSTLIATIGPQSIYESTNGGLTWTIVDIDLSVVHRKLEGMAQPGMFLSYGEAGVNVSVDHARTWKKISSHCCVNGADITSNGDIFIADKSIGVIKFPFPANPDDLVNWNPLAWVTVFPKQTSINDSDIQLGVSVTGKLFVNYRSDADGKTMFKSSVDQGATWQNVSVTGYTGNQYVVNPVWSLSPLGKLYLFDNNSTSGYKTWEFTDGSPTPWVQKGWPTVAVAVQEVSSVAWKNNTIALASAKTDGIFKTNNTTASWAQSSIGIYFGQGYNVAVLNSGRIVYLQGFLPNGFYYSTNGGVLWEFQPFPYPIDQLIELPDNSLMLNAGGYVHFSTDGGVTWTSNTAVKYEFRDIIVVAANDIYGLARDGTIRNTIDKGATWTTINVTGLPPVQLLKGTRDDDGFFYVFNGTTYWKIDSQLDPWIATELTLPEMSGGNSAIAMFSLNNKIYLSTSENFVTADKGLTWKNLGVAGVMMPILQKTGGIGFGDEHKFSVSQDDGNTVRSTSLPLPDAWIRGITIDPNGDFIAAAYNSPALKLTEDLILDPGDVAPYVDFDWQPFNGGPPLDPDNTLFNLEIFKERLYTHTYYNLYTSTDAATEWSPVSLGTDVRIHGMLQTADERLVGWGYGIHQTSDGINWTTISTAGIYYGMATANGSEFYALTADVNGKFTITRSTNLITWTTPILIEGIVSAINPNITVDANGKVYIVESSNARTVYQVTFGVATQLSFIQNAANVEFHNNTIIIYSNDGFIYSSVDGITWTTKVTPRGNKLIVTALNYYFIPGGNNLLWVSRNQGDTWQNVGDPDLASHPFEDVVINEFNGHAYGIVGQNPAQKSTNIVVTGDVTAPLQTSLSPASPGTDVPINTTLSITFNEAAFPVSDAKLRIFLKTGGLAMSLDATSGVRTGKNFTYTLPVPLAYLSEYYVIIDHGAFVDVSQNEFAGITSDQIWKFSTLEAPDIISPIIQFSTSNINLERSSGTKTFGIQVTDNKILASDKINIHYRKIASGDYTSEIMILGTTQFEKELSATQYDEIGLEFYFTAEDQTGNAVRSPVTGVYYSYINYGTFSPVVTGLSAGGKTENYRIMTIPHQMTNAKVAAILNELGDPGQNSWRMFTYDNDGSDAQWLEYPDFTTFERGKGYWINMMTQTELKVEGASSPANNRENFFTMTLQPGWNQIGNPYPLPISWPETQAGNPDAQLSAFKKFTAVGYQNATQVNAFEGGFVYLFDVVPKQITIRFPGITSGKLPGRTFDSDISSERWLLTLALQQGSAMNSLAAIGMHPQALEKLDPYDDVNPPKFLNSLEVKFRHASTIPLAQDIVPPAAEYVWNFTIEADGKSSAELRWNNTLLGNNNRELYLFDVSLQQRISMRDHDHYSFDSRESTVFRIYYGENLEEKIKPDFVLLGNAFPNPSSGKTFIPFTIPAQADGQPVKLEVCDINGTTIANLKNETLKAGFYQAEWNPQDSKLPDGLYLYRLVVNGTNPQVIYKRIILHN